MEETRCRSTSRSQDKSNLQTTRDFFAMKTLQGSAWTTSRKKKKGWTANGPSKDRSTNLPRGKRSVHRTQRRTEDRQSRPDLPPQKKRKGQLEKESLKPTEKPQRRRIKDRPCEAHQNAVKAGNPEEKRRSEQSTNKKPPKRHKHTKNNQIQAKGKKRKISDKRESAKNVTKLVQPDSKDGKKKNRRN